MGGLFGGNQQQQQATTGNRLGPYPDDNPVRMPVSEFQSHFTNPAARKKREAIINRTGRTSTRLAADKPAGTTSYSNSFLGSVG